MPKEFRHIIRIAETDLDGSQKVAQALTGIKGIGISLASTVVKRANISSEARLGFLSDIEIARIRDIIDKPQKHGMPNWLLNRQKDSDTGKDLHLTGSDLTLQIKSDIDEMKKIKSWRGFRHAHGLKLRGQRTRTTGRSGKAIGVKKKRVSRER
jgi:small subunit ribosomal protein S13